MALRSFAISTCRSCAYAALAFVVTLYNAWLELKHICATSISSAASRFPGLPAALKRLAAAGGSSAGERGSAPKKATVLGVVLAHDLQGDQAVCRLLTWVLHHGFCQLFIYEPGGALQRRQAELQLLVRQAGLDRQIVLWAGWQPPAAFGSGDPLSCHADRRMGVALLSAADAEWPLLAAAAASPMQPKAGSNAAERALDEAVAAPVALRERLGAVAGPMVELEPDLVLVFGDGLTLAGYPPWAARTAELYWMGRLSGLTAGKLAAVLRRFRRTRQRFGR